MDALATPTPASIVDVTPPPQAAATKPVLAEPPALEPADAPQPFQSIQPRKASKPAGSLPVLAIICAIGLFVTLSALAYYAYAKSK